VDRVDALRAALASTTQTRSQNAIGAAELEVGQFVYRRIEKLMDAKADTPEGRELDFLAELVSNVEEYGAQGDEGGEPWSDHHWAPTRSQGGGESISEEDIPRIVEDGKHGAALSVAEQAAWTGYELGFRDGIKNGSHPAEGGDGLLEALKGAVSDLEQTLRWRGEGWECSEEELLGEYRTAIAKASRPSTEGGEHGR
jgi:hypothetical protein